MISKELLLIVGLFITTLVSIINISILLQNRKNNLREHIYKEQIRINNLLFAEFQQLNSHITELINNTNTINKFKEIYESVQNIILQNEHILSNEIFIIAQENLIKSTLFFQAFSEKNDEKILETKNSYFIGYFSLIEVTRGQYGIDKLLRENQKLYKIPKYIEKLNKN